MDYVLLLAIAVFTIVFLSTIDLIFGIRSMTKLSTVAQIHGEELPMVSVVVPACNEEENIESAIRSLLRQDYTNLEIIAVNDRSSDDTGILLEKLQQKYPHRLRVFHVEHLPPGWMGKNHALNLGADRAGGEYLLFTDGDIHMEQSTISRAIGYMRRENLDHISLLFKNSSPGILLNGLILDAGIGLCQCFRPWRAKSTSSRNYIGVGAFNLFRRDAFVNSGGFETIKMHPVDDIMLGKTIKRNGFLQECLLGHDLVTVPWYGSVGQMIDGLTKNALAVINYRFYLVAPLLAVLFMLNIFPLWGMVLLDGLVRFAFCLVVLMKLTVYYGGTRLFGISPWCTLGALVSPYILFFIILKATWRNARDNGIYWRGTHYSLDELRKNEKLLF